LQSLKGRCYGIADIATGRRRLITGVKKKALKLTGSHRCAGIYRATRADLVDTVDNQWIADLGMTHTSSGMANTLYSPGTEAAAPRMRMLG